MLLSNLSLCVINNLSIFFGQLLYQSIVETFGKDSSIVCGTIMLGTKGYYLIFLPRMGRVCHICNSCIPMSFDYCYRLLFISFLTRIYASYMQRINVEDIADC